LGTQSEVRQLEFELMAIALDRSGKTELAILSHGVNEHLAFGINQKSMALGCVCGGALGGLDADRRRDATGVRERRSHCRELLVPMFAVCGLSTNRFARLFPQRLRLHLHCSAKTYGRATTRARSSAQNSSR